MRADLPTAAFPTTAHLHRSVAVGGPSFVNLLIYINNFIFTNILGCGPERSERELKDGLGEKRLDFAAEDSGQGTETRKCRVSFCMGTLQSFWKHVFLRYDSKSWREFSARLMGLHTRIGFLEHTGQSENGFFKPWSAYKGAGAGSCGRRPKVRMEFPFPREDTGVPRQEHGYVDCVRSFVLVLLLLDQAEAEMLLSDPFPLHRLSPCSPRPLLAGISDGQWVVDRTRIEIGTGKDTFNRAKKLLQEWQQFQLGWSVVDPKTPIKKGQGGVTMLRSAAARGLFVDPAGPVSSGVCVSAGMFNVWIRNPLEISYVEDTNVKRTVPASSSKVVPAVVDSRSSPPLKPPCFYGRVTPRPGLSDPTRSAMAALAGIFWRARSGSRSRWTKRTTRSTTRSSPSRDRPTP